MKIILLFILTLYIGMQAFSQDSLFLLGGERRAVKVLEKNDSILVYSKPGSTKRKNIYLHNLYSIKYESGTEVVVYKQDPTLDFFLTPDQMKIYLKGYYDGKETFKPLVSDIYSGLIGLAFPSVITPIPWGAVGTGIGVGANIALRPRINWDKYGDKELKKDEVYQSGFMDAAQKKKLFRSLIISGICFSIATTVNIIILSQQSGEN
jgi:hypothetical protein